MNRLILHILAVLLLWGFPALAAEVVVVQGERMAPFEAAIDGFEATAGVRSVDRLVLSELQGADVVRTVREAHPRLVLAVGSEALDRVSEIREIPIVYLMVASSGRAGSNATGVTMTIAPEHYFNLVRNSFHGRRIGVLFNPARSGALMREAHAAAERLGMTIVAREVKNPRQVPEQLESLKGKIDAFWLIPDVTVVGPESLESLALFSQSTRVPVVAFAAKYLKYGAVAAFDANPRAIGRQAALMARGILGGRPVKDIPPENPADLTLRVNPTVAGNLRLAPGQIRE